MPDANPGADHAEAVQPHHPGPIGDDRSGDDAGHLTLDRAGWQLSHCAAILQHGGGLEPGPLAVDQDTPASAAGHLPSGRRRGGSDQGWSRDARPGSFLLVAVRQTGAGSGLFCLRLSQCPAADVSSVAHWAGFAARVAR